MFDFSVFLRGVTWIRDSHGLFDYESKSITKKSLKTTQTSKIVRMENEIEMVHIQKAPSEFGPSAQTLLQIKQDPNSGKSQSVKIVIGNSFVLDHAENCDMMEEDSVDRLWLVVRSLKKPEGKFVRALRIYHPCV